MPARGARHDEKLMLAVLVAALVQSPAAVAAYIGTISGQTGYTVEISAGASVTTSVTFLSVVRGRLEVDDVMTVNGNLPPIPITISRSAERGILLMDTQGGSALIRINGGVLQEFSANPDVRIVFDVTDRQGK
jgi:hypothetical protein